MRRFPLLSGGDTYAAGDAEGKVVVAGSSSVSPVMEKLKEGYEAAQDKVTVEVQTSDSTTGVTSVADGICDIGMASRELKDEETEQGLTPTVIATDGIAVIVNTTNEVEDLTSEQVKSIFTGETTEWEAVEDSAAATDTEADTEAADAEAEEAEAE